MRCDTGRLAAFGARASIGIDKDEDIAIHATCHSAIKQRKHLQSSSTARAEMRIAVRFGMQMMDGITEKVATTPGYATFARGGKPLVYF